MISVVDWTIVCWSFLGQLLPQTKSGQTPSRSRGLKRQSVIIYRPLLTRTISNQIKVEERRKLLAWLGELSRLNFDSDHERIFDKWLVGTGDWLLQSPEFTRWVDKQESSLLWCFGNRKLVFHVGNSFGLTMS